MYFNSSQPGVDFSQCTALGLTLSFLLIELSASHLVREFKVTLNLHFPIFLCCPSLSSSEVAWILCCVLPGDKLGVFFYFSLGTTSSSVPLGHLGSAVTRSTMKVSLIRSCAQQVFFQWRNTDSGKPTLKPSY